MKIALEVSSTEVTRKDVQSGYVSTKLSLCELSGRCAHSDGFSSTGDDGYNPFPFYLASHTVTGI